MTLTIANGTIVTPGGLVDADLRIDGSTISSMEPAGSASGRVIDASGCLVGPGFVDLHVHFRDPGQTWKEDTVTGSRAAAAGGYTAVVVMPNTEPALDTPELVASAAEAGRDAGLIEVHVAAALTKSRAGFEASDIESLSTAGVTIFSDDGDSVADPVLLQDLMERVGAVGGLVSQHAEDAPLTASGHMHEGAVSERLGIGGLPAEAESSIVERDIDLARRTGCRYHCQHVSSAQTVAIIKAAKAEGLPVTAEVTPHHLWFTDEDVGDGLNTNLKMYPPLRTRADRHALREALIDGTIDCVATDHAPHSDAEKSVPFSDAPRGVIGLETAASVAWETLADPLRFFRVMATEPAKIGQMGRQGHLIEVGVPANLAVFDPDDVWTPSEFASRSDNSPFTGLELRGRPRATIYEGKVTHELSMST